eukprot:c1111_g1_i1.p1 GENE.c1111_g1_i1~~c1111_g1_i1.p1  ORF type:complete len:101 (-),score=46.14 c1111_g1_i1:232-534(-)
MMAKLSITDTHKASTFTTELQAKALEQSIEMWMEHVGMGKYANTFKTQGCDTFRVLFDALDDETWIDAVLDVCEMQGPRRDVFKKQAQKERSEMMGHNKE